MDLRNIHAGSVMGIPIKLHFTIWLLIPFIVVIIAMDVNNRPHIWTDFLVGNLSHHSIDPDQITTEYTPWIIGVFAAIGLLFSVAYHELGHSWVAMRYDLDIDHITLWILGGIAHIENPPKHWRKELWISIAGPISSVVLGLFFLVLLQISPPSVPGLLVVLGWLSAMNILLAGFNALPAFPMDGGRILRAYLARDRPYREATNQAADVGKIMAVLMGLAGVVLLNPILVLIALFVYIAGSSESRMIDIDHALNDVDVRDIMTREVSTVDPDLSIEDLANKMLSERHTGYPVVSETNGLVGIITLSDIKDINPGDRGNVSVKDLMTTEVLTVKPHAQAFDALQTLSKNGIGRLVVMDNGEMTGIISRTDVMKALDVIEAGGRIDIPGTDKPGLSTEEPSGQSDLNRWNQ